MEVNLSVFLVAAGLLVLFTLFPYGLEESEKAMTDSQEAMFAEHVLNTIKGSAMSMTNWTEWSNGKFDADLNVDNIHQAVSRSEPARKLDSFPFVTSTKDTIKPLQYHLLVEDYYPTELLSSAAFPQVEKSRKRVILSVRGGKYGKMDEDTKCYVTDVYYMGM